MRPGIALVFTKSRLKNSIQQFLFHRKCTNYVMYVINLLKTTTTIFEWTEFEKTIIFNIKSHFENLFRPQNQEYVEFSYLSFDIGIRIATFHKKLLIGMLCLDLVNGTKLPSLLRQDIKIWKGTFTWGMANKSVPGSQ